MKRPDSFAQMTFKKTTAPLHQRKRPADTEGGQEIWLLTMSDLMMLLMIFFILFFTIIYARHLSARPATADVNVEAAASEPEAQPAIAKEPVPPPAQVAREQAEPMDATFSELQRTLAQSSGWQDVLIERRRENLVLTFPEQIIFDSGQADLKTAAQPVLQTIAQFIDAHPALVVEIQGHTDSRPIRNLRYPSNWELSAARATQVARALVDRGISPVRITARGFGEYHPVSDNETEEGRGKNRRVEIRLAATPTEG
jgi:chemotaxis protein MotB